MSKPFWKHDHFGRTNEWELGWVHSALVQKAFDEKQCLHSYYRSGTLRDGVNILDFVRELAKTNKDAWVVHHSLPRSKGGDEGWTIVGEQMAIDLDYTHKNRALAVSAYAMSVVTIEVIRTTLLGAVVKKVTKGRVYVVAQANSGPYLHELGSAGEAFIPTNYHPSVVVEYNHIVKDLNSEDPCGMVVILDGEPGTGKTHMVRALLNEVPKAMFVLVPSNMMSTLGSPQFIRTLLDNHTEGHPLILIIEDADECLSSRKADNVSEISALLNFTDGILGKQLDMRIIATTNVDMEDLDPAVVRDGRLCRRIGVGKLDANQAERVYLRLTGKASQQLFKSGQFYTLAEIYRAARGTGSSTMNSPKHSKKVGFQLDEPEPTKSPAEEMDLTPGQVLTTDQGELVRVRPDGELEMIDERDLIDEDPEGDD